MTVILLLLFGILRTDDIYKEPTCDHLVNFWFKLQSVSVDINISTDYLQGFILKQWLKNELSHLRYRSPNVKRNTTWCYVYIFCYPLVFVNFTELLKEKVCLRFLQMKKIRPSFREIKMQTWRKRIIYFNNVYIFLKLWPFVCEICNGWFLS